MALIFYYNGLKLQTTIRCYDHAAGNMLWQIIRERYKTYEKSAPLRDAVVWDYSISQHDLNEEESQEVWKGVFTSLFRANQSIYNESNQQKQKNWDKAMTNPIGLSETTDKTPDWRLPPVLAP